ncbi:MAG TPA: head-tail connector protein, partial [Allosphingosinicella sp.]|nr:head-tail connector protein [Allosphingosinicella sp.]
MPAPIVPAAAPVPLEQVKAFLRVAGSEEDALLAGLVRTAAALCEAFTRSALIEREVEETISAG